MSDQIKLDDCPKILRDAVKAKLAKYSEYSTPMEIISCTVYKSSNEVNTTYKSYLFNLNTFTILTYIETPPEHFKFGVMKDLITIGEIKEIIRSAPQWFYK